MFRLCLNVTQKLSLTSKSSRPGYHRWPSSSSTVFLLLDWTANPQHCNWGTGKVDFDWGAFNCRCLFPPFSTFLWCSILALISSIFIFFSTTRSERFWVSETPISPCESLDLAVSCFKTFASFKDDGWLPDPADKDDSPAVATPSSAAALPIELGPSSERESLLGWNIWEEVRFWRGCERCEMVLPDDRRNCWSAKFC